MLNMCNNAYHVEKSDTLLIKYDVCLVQLVFV